MKETAYLLQAALISGWWIGLRLVSLSLRLFNTPDSHQLRSGRSLPRHYLDRGFVHSARVS